MILENKTEVTVPAVMAMQKAMNRQGQLARYLIAGLFLLGAIWQIGYLLVIGTWIQSYFYGILFCVLVAGFLLIMPIWSNKKVLKQVTQQLCNSSAPLINHYYFQPQMLKIRDEGIPDGRDLQLPYSDITRFLQDDTYFFLYVKSSSCYVNFLLQSFYAVMIVCKKMLCYSFSCPKDTAPDERISR